MTSVPDSDPMELAPTVPPNTKLVQALKQLSLNRIRHEVEMQRKMFQVELEYQEKLNALDEQRRKIVSGEHEPTEEECKYEFANPEETVVESEEKGIPKFWSTIFLNLDILGEMVQMCDQELIECITNIRCVLLSEPMGYRLEFEFAENKYFTNKVLTKEYYFAESFDKSDPLNYDSPYVNRCKGCKIDWKSPEMDLTQKKISKKMKHKDSNQVKTVEKMQKCDSFFNFFDPPEDTLEEADDETKELLATDIDIGETFRMNVIPRAIIYYTGEGIEDYSDDDMDEMNEFDDYDDDDDDDDDEDDDDEQEEGEDDDKNKPLTRRNRAKGAQMYGARRAGGRRRGDSSKPPECNTQ